MPPNKRKRKQDQPVKNHQGSILQYLAYGTDSVKRRRVEKFVETAQSQLGRPEVAIPFRPDGSGNGAYYDHKVFQQKASTVMLHEHEKSHTVLTEHLRTVTHQLQGPLDPDERRPVPRHITLENMAVERNGLLVLPGVSRRVFESSAEEERYQHIQAIIKQAVLLGQPILAICGGCWDLWRFYGGALMPARDHSYRGGMPRIKDSTGKVGYNKMVHRIRVIKDTLLANAMADTTGELFAVNSVHWLAVNPDPDFDPDPDVSRKYLLQFDIAAYSSHDSNLVPKARDTGEPALLPAENLPEAFSSKFGAPQIGVQWHPEAYSAITPAEYMPQNHAALIQYMIEAGRAFKAKKAVLSQVLEYASQPSGVKAALRPATLDTRRGHHVFSAKCCSEDLSKIVTMTASQHRKVPERKEKYVHVAEIRQSLFWKKEYLREKSIQQARVLIL